MYRFILLSDGNHETYKSNTPTSLDNEGEPWITALCHEGQWWFYIGLT